MDIDIDEVLEVRRRREQEDQHNRDIEERAKQAEADKERSDALGDAIGKVWRP